MWPSNPYPCPSGGAQVPGLGRASLTDSNWKVCWGRSPEALPEVLRTGAQVEERGLRGASSLP